MVVKAQQVSGDHIPSPKTTAAVKRTNDEQRMPQVEQDAARQRERERHEGRR